MSKADLSRRGLLIVSSAAAAIMLLGRAAQAHAHLASSIPAANAVLDTAPASLSLTFSEAISLKFSGAVVTGPEKVAVKLGAAMLDPKSDKTLIVPISEPLKPGRYSVAWHNLSNDGHRLTGSFAFSVK